METFPAKSFINKKYVYINEPISLIDADYEKALHNFSEKFSSYTNVVSIYKFGSVSSVGISDLDFIAILKKEPLVQKKGDLAYKGFSPKDIYIYNNTPPMYMSEEIFSNFHRIFPLSGLQLIYGKEIKQNISSNPDVYNQLILIELLSKFYPKVFLELLFADHFNTRRALLILHALIFPINMAAKYVKIEPNWLEYKDKVIKLRTNWYAMTQERYSLLISLVCDAVTVSLELIDKVKNYLMQKSSVSAKKDNDQIIGNLQRGRCLYINNFSAKKALEIIIKRYESKKWPKRFALVLPDIFILPLSVYSQAEGILSNHLKKNLKITEPFHGVLEHESEAKIRISDLNSLMSFIEKFKVFPNGIHSYYGYWPKVGIKNRTIQKLANAGLL